MRRQGVCDSLFESSDHTDFIDIKEKSRQPRGGTLEHFDFFSTKMTVIRPGDLTHK